MEVPSISRPLLRFFQFIVRGYFRRHFHAVRGAGMEHFRNARGPLIVYANHSSWWDPMVAVLLAAKAMPRRAHYAPMDAVALDRYALLKRIGIFPVALNAARGAAQFLRTGQAIVRAGGVLWVTPQGQFVDARARPLTFKPGLAALAARVAPCTVLPLAIEYPFWEERMPECLVRFYEPVHVAAGEEAVEVERRLLGALETAMDELKEQALRREASGFETLYAGVVGPGGFYALGQRARALLTRTQYRPEHARPVPPRVPAPCAPATCETGQDRA